MDASDTNETKQLYVPNKGRHEDPQMMTFITPFVSVVFLALPSLLVIAYAKQTAGYNSLVISGFYSLAIVFLWMLVPLSVFFGALYIWRGKSHAAKTMVVILTTVLVASFIYVVWPE